MIKIGLIGLGNHMLSQMIPNLLKLPVVIMAVCDKEEEKLARVSRYLHLNREKCYLSWEEMLEKETLDGVICVADADLHYRAAAASLRRRIPVFVEKTPCLSAVQAAKLCCLQKEYNCFGMAGFNRRYATSYRMMKKVIGTEAFGNPCLYMAKYNSSPYRDSRYFVLNHVIHHLDLMRYLLGEIDRIDAQRIEIADGKTGYHIRFRSVSGCMGFLQSASLQWESYPMERVEITGNGCCITADNVKSLQYNRPVSAKTERYPILGEEDSLCWNYNQGHSSMYSHYGYERELADFVKAVRDGKQPENTFDDVYGTMLLYERLLENSVDLQMSLTIEQDI